MDGIKICGCWVWGDGVYVDVYFYYGFDFYGWSCLYELVLGVKNGVSGSYLMLDDGSLLMFYYYVKLWVLVCEGLVVDYFNIMVFNWVLFEGVIFMLMLG